MNTGYFRTLYSRLTLLRPIRQLPRQGQLAIGALVMSKVADILTTIAGLVLIRGLVEANPVARGALLHAGFPGLVVVSLLGIGIVVSVVEWSLRLGNIEERCGSHGRLLLYAGSYYPLTILYCGAAVHNLLLITSSW